MGNLLHLVLKAWQLNDIKTESNLYPNCIPGKKPLKQPCLTPLSSLGEMPVEEANKLEYNLRNVQGVG